MKGFQIQIFQAKNKSNQTILILSQDMKKKRRWYWTVENQIRCQGCPKNFDVILQAYDFGNSCWNNLTFLQNVDKQFKIWYWIFYICFVFRLSHVVHSQREVSLHLGILDKICKRPCMCIAFLVNMLSRVFMCVHERWGVRARNCMVKRVEH